MKLVYNFENCSFTPNRRDVVEAAVSAAEGFMDGLTRSDMLSLAHLYISNSGIADGYQRWLCHQVLNLSFQVSLAEERGDEISVGVFRSSSHPAELSLFGRYPETVRKRLSTCGDIIGLGCSSLQEPIHLRTYFGESNPIDQGKDYPIDWSKDQDWGWEDCLGVHIERWDAEKRTYRRKSMSGRTSYTIFFKEDGTSTKITVG